MKYTEEDYLNCGFYQPSEDEQCYQSKVTTARRPHECVNCGGPIRPKEKYFRESCIMYEKRRTSKTCLNCLDEWIDEVGTN